MRRVHRILIAGLLGIALAGCPDTAEGPAEPELRPVRVAQVARNGDQRQRSFTGISQSTQEARMSFKVGGTVISIPVQVGDRLAKGDVIARLDPSNYDLGVQQAEASLAQAAANQRNADASYSRAKELYANNNASRNDLDSARASAESAAAQVRSAAKALELARLDRSDTRLTAASACTVAAIDVELNENVSAGSPVAIVNCGEGVEVRFDVPESLIGGLQQGMAAQVRFNALPGRTFEARVTELGLAAGGSAATFPLVVTLANPDSTVRPGMAADVTLDFRSEQSGAIAVPSSAVVNDERGQFVFVARPSGDGTATIARHVIEIGELTENGIEVLTGLEDGDLVVTAGTSVIRDGQTVLLP